MKLTGSDIRRLAHAQIIGMEDARRFVATGVSIDSRTVARGDLFIALKGEQFDGHNFLTKAVESGAAAVVVENRWAEANPALLVSIHVPRIIVANTVEALGQLANLHRNRFSLPVIAVGGSNGKTTTKEMIRAALAPKYRVLATEGNLNNHIGVPLTLFRLEKKHEIAVVEVGTNHPGEIATLCAILEPTHGLITNIGHEHLEFFGSLDGVAAAEAELFAYLAAHKGTAFVNADDARLRKYVRSVTKTVTYGMRSRTATVRGSVASTSDRGCSVVRISRSGSAPFTVELGVPGAHSAQNAVAAAAVALAFRVPRTAIQKALADFSAVSKRMQVEQIAGVTVLNDTYNANPDSVLAALATLRGLRTSGRKIAVLADMLELGPDAVALHRTVGQAVGRHGVDTLLTYGPLSRHTNDAAVVPLKAHYEHKNMLAEVLLESLAAGDAVLIKGSRGMRMEDVVTFLAERLPSKGQK